MNGPPTMGGCSFTLEMTNGESLRERTGFAKTFALLALPLAAYGSYKGGLFKLLADNPTAQFSYAGILALYLCSGPSWLETSLNLAGGILLWLLCPFTTGVKFFGEPFFAVVGFIGLSSVLALVARAILIRDRKPALEALARSSLFVTLGIVLGIMLTAASVLRPYKYDYVLYVIDMKLGMPISFLTGRLLQISAVFRELEVFVYYSLPLALALMWVGDVNRKEPGHINIPLLLCLDAMVGYGLYFVYPAAGPIYAFGPAFPWAPPVPAHLPLRSVILSAAPNAMPSLHLAGAVLIWWNVRRFWRPVALVYLVLTALSAMGFGEHYFVDLVVAFPFALTMQAAAARGSRRVWALVAGAAMTAFWLIAFLSAPAALAAARPSALWAAVIITIAVPLILERELLSREELARTASLEFCGGGAETGELH